MIDLGWQGLLVIAALIVIARPLAALTLVGLPFTWREKVFGSMAPRGIVAFNRLRLRPRADRARSAQGRIRHSGDLPDHHRHGLLLLLLTPWLAKVLGLAGEHRPTLMMIGAPPWRWDHREGLTQAGAEVLVWTESVEDAEAAARRGLVSSVDRSIPRSMRRIPRWRMSPLSPWSARMTR